VAAFAVLRIWILLVSIFQLAGCSASSQSDGYDRGNFSRRKLVYFQEQHPVAMPFGASIQFHSTFEDNGVDLKEFRRRADSVLAGELASLASYARYSIDPTIARDSGKVVQFGTESLPILALVPREIKDTNILVLGLGIVDYTKMTDYGNPARGSLVATMAWVVYDPRIRSAVAGHLYTPLRLTVSCHSPERLRWFEVSIASRYILRAIRISARVSWLRGGAAWEDRPGFSTSAPPCWAEAKYAIFMQWATICCL